MPEHKSVLRADTILATQYRRCENSFERNAIQSFSPVGRTAAK
jgi:hypothetical protein